MKRLSTSLSASLLLILGCFHSASGAVSFTSIEFLSGTTAAGEVLNMPPGVSLSGSSTSYDIMTDELDPVVKRDAAGAPAPADLPDITFSGTSAGVGSAITLNPTGDRARIRFNESHVTVPLGSNNPGTVHSNTLSLTFASHIEITDASFNFTSLNTAGISWEYSVLRFLDASGNYFSPIAGPGWTLGATGQYISAGGGFSGAAGLGNFVAASTGTVTGVGTDTTVTGTTGGNNDLVFNYSVAGLAPGTIISGIEWTTYLEDVRGTLNLSISSLTSSLQDFTISGTIPEPSSALLGMLGAGFLLRRKR